MANFLLIEIPNAPQTLDMPLAQYPDIPSIRYSGVDMKVNMGRQAEALQQSPLKRLQCECFAQARHLLMDRQGIIFHKTRDL